jgi:hypothetical protein
MEQPMMEH